MPRQFSEFSRKEIDQSAWTMVLMTCMLRHEPVWSSFRQLLCDEKELNVNDLLSTGFGPVGDRVGIYLFTTDRQVIYAELAEFSKQRCRIHSWDDTQYVDPDAVTDRVAVYLLSSDESLEWFNQQVALCRDKEQQLRDSLGDGYSESALLQTEEYIQYHRSWLMPRVKEFFDQVLE